ncbi:unnamed protein product [Closterium sp. NIES-65]|nr:unnamed protein product [Closterium sp. NIES-65]
MATLRSAFILALVLVSLPALYAAAAPLQGDVAGGSAGVDAASWGRKLLEASGGDVDVGGEEEEVGEATDGLDEAVRVLLSWKKIKNAANQAAKSEAGQKAGGLVKNVVKKGGKEALTAAVNAFRSGKGAKGALQAGAGSFLPTFTASLATVTTDVTAAAVTTTSRSRVTARNTTTLPCPAVPSGSLTGFHVPSFSRNLVGVRPLVSQHVGVWIEPSGETAVAASPQVAVSGPVAASCSCRSLAHPTVLWHHRTGHPSLPRLRAMSRQRLVLGLPRVLPSLLPSLAPPCGPCVEGRLCATPHSSSLRPATEPFETLHLDVWGPAPPLALALSASVSFWWYAAHQLNLWPRVSRPESSPTSLWTWSPGVASRFRVWGCLALVRDTSADKLSPHAVPCIFLGFLEDSFDFTFYHPPSHRFFDSRDVRFEESTAYYARYPSRGVSQATPPPSVAPQV